MVSTFSLISSREISTSETSGFKLAAPHTTTTLTSYCCLHLYVAAWVFLPFTFFFFYMYSIFLWTCCFFVVHIFMESTLFVLKCAKQNNKCASRLVLPSMCERRRLMFVLGGVDGLVRGRDLQGSAVNFSWCCIKSRYIYTLIILSHD